VGGGLQLFWRQRKRARAKLQKREKVMSKGLQLQNAVLGHFLTQWDEDQTLESIFLPHNGETIVWDQYTEWDLTNLKDHIKALIKSLVEIEVA
jgi:hypothetical protein